ncbi:hypothetical protein RRG08_019518 [Elysia crispata]|uniref:Uncharacterized protein n=1 Tax=Elysia crispata TaxID=231223 RepID=A0AAE0YY21_9GAST|nr:hypothetical protein RRG08_019518 [Elysia crispata]
MPQSQEYRARLEKGLNGIATGDAHAVGNPNWHYGRALKTNTRGTPSLFYCQGRRACNIHRMVPHRLTIMTALGIDTNRCSGINLPIRANYFSSIRNCMRLIISNIRARASRDKEELDWKEMVKGSLSLRLVQCH